MNLIYGNSEIFKKVMERTHYFAKTPWPVLLLGETGTGKELLAKQIHESSTRALLPFIPVNCGALPAGLFESELFGYERGAFSGATQSYKGLARFAHGGTLFLDEIGDLDLPLQVKLLRLIDQGEVRSVGSSRIDKVDVRVVAATNVNLFEAVKEGKFRLDLLERISVLTIKIPSLKERAEDIFLIANHIVQEIGAVVVGNLSPILLQYDWPGNIRELRNLLIRASVLGDKQISPDVLKMVISEVRESQSTLNKPENKTFSQGTLEDIEKEIIIERLKRCHGNRKKTAKDLGIAKSTLHEKLRKWKMEIPSPLSWPIHRMLPISSNPPQTLCGP